MAMTSRNRPTWHASLRLFMMMFALGTPCAPSALRQMDGNQGYLCFSLYFDSRWMECGWHLTSSIHSHFCGMAISVFVSIMTLLSAHQTLPFPLGSIWTARRVNPRRWWKCHCFGSCIHTTGSTRNEWTQHCLRRPTPRSMEPWQIKTVHAEIYVSSDFVQKIIIKMYNDDRYINAGSKIMYDRVSLTLPWYFLMSTPYLYQWMKVKSRRNPMSPPFRCNLLPTDAHQDMCAFSKSWTSRRWADHFSQQQSESSWGWVTW